MLKTYCTILTILLTGASICRAQDGARLTAIARVSTAVVRGGETFTVTTTVANRGTSASANTTIFAKLDTLASFASAAASGDCRISDHNQKVLCRLGELEPGASTVVTMEIKVADFGDVSRPPDKTFADDQSRILSGSGAVFSDGATAKGENFDFRITAQPSRNAPPRVEILEPGAVYYIDPSERSPAIPVRVKAFDPDGAVVRVALERQNVPFVVEDNVGKYVIGDKKYTEEEIRRNPDYFRPFFEIELAPAGGGIYLLKLTEFKYGKNRLSIRATDDGGRSHSVRIDFEVRKRAGAPSS